MDCSPYITCDKFLYIFIFLVFYGALQYSIMSMSEYDKMGPEKEPEINDNYLRKVFHQIVWFWGSDILFTIVVVVN